MAFLARERASNKPIPPESSLINEFSSDPNSMGFDKGGDLDRKYNHEFIIV